MIPLEIPLLWAEVSVFPFGREIVVAQDDRAGKK